MRNFFIIVFGGLAAILLGLSLWYGVNLGLDSAIAKVQATLKKEGTTMSGLKKLVMYTANEEEDILDSASLSIPGANDGNVSAPSYLVKNLSSQDVPAISKNPDQSLPIASLTKLITAAVARRLIGPNTHITISDNIIGTYGNTASFKKGETFLADDLLYPLLMVSSNDAAEAFAEAYGRKKFVKAMNDFTQSIGAYRTYAADPSGLSKYNVSTANDLVIILDWIRKNDPLILQITTLKTKTLRSHTWVNPTHFLSWSNYVGGKNGYIPESNRTAASLFTMGKDRDVYAVIVLGSKSRDADELKLLKKVTE